MKYHMAAFFGGFFLDLLLGDPEWVPHPIRLIGFMISKLEKVLLGKKERSNRDKLRRGVMLAVFAPAVSVLVSGAILALAWKIHMAVGIFAEMVMTWQILAAKCLKTESMKVYTCLKQGDLPAARKAVSMIVGRDTECLDADGVTRAAIETVAENTSDGVIAPMLYTALGGPVFGFFYKTVNTMDSMVGYKNDRYLYFGRAAARLDDAVNYLPSRISALFMIFAAFCSGKPFSGKGAFRIWRRDKRKHASPNSAQTESVCAGALGIRLAGDANYFGKTVKKPYIGDPVRPVETEDIKRVNRLMYRTAWISEGICLGIMAAFVLSGR